MNTNDQLLKNLIKKVKKRDTKNLFSILFMHINYVFEADLDELEQYIKDYYAFENGYQLKNKLFNKLFNLKVKFPDLKYAFLLNYAKIRKQDYHITDIKHYDELIHFGSFHSKLAVLYSIVDSALENIKFYEVLARFDYLAIILLNFSNLKENNKVNFPSVMVFDYKVDFTLDNLYLINDKFIFLWETLYKKIISFNTDLTYLIANRHLKYDEFVVEYINGINRLLKEFRTNNYR